MKRKMVLGILFIFIGVVSFWLALTKFTWDYIESHTERTHERAYAIDNNIQGCIYYYEEAIDDFLESNGKPEDVKESSLAKDPYVQDVLIMKNEEIIFSLKSVYEYSFEKIEGNEDLSFALKDGKLYGIAISKAGKKNETYVALIKIDSIYKAITSDNLKGPDEVILIDESNRFLMLSHHGEFWAGNIEQAPAELDNKECVGALSKANMELKERYVLSYERNHSQKEKVEYIFRLPKQETKNELFIIGLPLTVGETIAEIKKMGTIILFSSLMLVSGIGICAWIIIKMRKEHKERKRELENLYERNALMEKKNQELQELAHHQRLETLGVLTSGIAHEFNNLLTPIMGYSVLTLEQIPEEGEVYDNILEIYGAAKKAKEVINRLSDISRKKDTISVEPVSVDDIVNKVLTVMSATKPKSVTVEKELHCNEQQVLGNETLLMQMVLNLVLNAFQATEEAGGIVKIRTEKTEEMAVISVEDDGLGMPEEIREKMFEPFFTTKDNTKGTGLGLAIVQQVVETHQGKIDVISELGKGCTIKVYLPIE